jgi:hypothetical protein
MIGGERDGGDRSDLEGGIHKREFGCYGALLGHSRTHNFDIFPKRTTPLKQCDGQATQTALLLTRTVEE